MLIAFTSDFIPQLLYRYEHDMSLEGYLNFSLAVAPVNSTPHVGCRYRQFRDHDGQHNPFYWRLIVCRLAFVIIFEVRQNQKVEDCLNKFLYTSSEVGLSERKKKNLFIYKMR